MEKQSVPQYQLPVRDRADLEERPERPAERGPAGYDLDLLPPADAINVTKELRKFFSVSL